MGTDRHAESSIGGMSDDQAISAWSDLKTQYAQISTQFGPAYPKVVEVGNQLKQVQETIQGETRRIGGRLQSEYQAATQREDLLQE